MARVGVRQWQFAAVWWVWCGVGGCGVWGAVCGVQWRGMVGWRCAGGVALSSWLACSEAKRVIVALTCASTNTAASSLAQTNAAVALAEC